MVNNLFFQPNSTLRLIRNGKRSLKKRKEKKKDFRATKKQKCGLIIITRCLLRKKKKILLDEWDVKNWAKNMRLKWKSCGIAFVAYILTCLIWASFNYFF